MTRNSYIKGIPNSVPETEAAVFRSRIFTAFNELLNATEVNDIEITVSTSSPSDDKSPNQRESSQEPSTEERSRQYQAREPLFSFEQLIVPNSVHEDILLALDLIELEHKVFDEWGLRSFEPFPRIALNFHGPSGTGKTLAAHAIASHIKRPILAASYAQIESMFHGEGPKNVEALFLAAERDHAVLFIDEADSLLSQRLLHVTQGSEQAINSMRSQLFICLEKFRGIVIFATNLVENYDKAFETRVRNIYFPMPDEASRREIWRKHLPPTLPLANDISLEALLDALAKIDDICGRDIRNAVIDTALRVARNGKPCLELSDLLNGIERVKASRITKSTSRDLKPDEEEYVKEKVKQAISQEKGSSSED
jgi:SpoVK/Ycf46/Vps4 family AAA+-type ATPase